MKNDYYFTARLGVLFSLILLILVFLGSCAKNEPKLIKPEFKVETRQVQAQEPRTLIEEIEFVFGDQAELAKKVAFCESSLNPKATHKDSTATGLFQILRGTFRQFKCSGDPLNYQDNIKCAKKIYDYYGEFGTRGGWAASRSCWQ